MLCILLLCLIPQLLGDSSTSDALLSTCAHPSLWALGASGDGGRSQCVSSCGPCHHSVRRTHEGWGWGRASWGQAGFLWPPSILCTRQVRQHGEPQGMGCLVALSFPGSRVQSKHLEEGAWSHCSHRVPVPKTLAWATQSLFICLELCERLQALLAWPSTLVC